MKEKLSYQWIKGSGLEIGGLHYPLPVSTNVQVTYVDLMSAEDLQIKFPEVAVKNLKIQIDNGETLSTVQDSSQDFVIANHVFEHCENPIQTFKNWLRVLKPGGVIYAALPDKNKCFDRKREVTPYWHILKDYTDGPDWSLEEHYRDWYTNSELEGKLQDQELEAQIQVAVQARQNIHFHVWDEKGLEYLVDRLNERFHLSQHMIHRNGSEFIVICQK